MLVKGRKGTRHFLCGIFIADEGRERGHGISRPLIRDVDGGSTTVCKATVVLLRAFANISDELEAAGYTPGEITRIKERVKHYVDLREIIRKASGETLDLKPYEADMRHLIDT